MRLYPGIVSSRLNYWDRQVSVRTLQYIATAVAPHAATTRATYTTGVGTLALVTFVSAHQLRTTAATAVGKVSAKVILTPVGASATSLVAPSTFNLAVGTENHMEGAPYALMVPADNIILQTADASTNGAVDYDLSAVIYEFLN